MLLLRSTRIVLVSLGVILFLALTAATTIAASASGAVTENCDLMCVGEDAVNLQGGCGDGICDPYMGESAATCPEDCAVTLTFIPTRTPQATRTPTCTSTSSVTPTPEEEESPTPSETPAQTLTPSEAESVGVIMLPGCDLVAYESRAQAWQKGYDGAVSPEVFVPERTDNREIYVCEVPPLGQLCIPIYQGLLRASQEDISNIVLVDCSIDGACQIHEISGRSEGDSICFDVAQSDDLSCSAGCALAPRQAGRFVLPFLSNIPFRVLAPSACLISLLFSGVALGIVFVTRRSRSREASVARSVPPPDWDVPLGGAGGGKPTA
ncbi:MAG: hypothetical protein JXB30_18595 [Anaerolineae bacterium]|nr:hypothetical protein [Anaerolineae bacterium]